MTALPPAGPPVGRDVWMRRIEPEGLTLAALTDIGSEFTDRGGPPIDEVWIADSERFAVVGPADDVHSVLSGHVVDAMVDDTHHVIHVADGWMLSTEDGWMWLPTGVHPRFVIGRPREPAWADVLRAAWPDHSLPPGRPMSEVAPEVVAVPYWSPEQCARLVALAEAVDGWGSDPDDPVPGDEVSLGAISPALLAALEHEVDRRLVPALRAQWPLFAWCGIHDAFVIRYRAPRGTPADASPRELSLHHDVAQISVSVRLNDGYDGGRLEFPRQGWDDGAVSVGTAVAWPSLVTHPHAGRPVTSGVKYGLTIWFRLPG